MAVNTIPKPFQGEELHREIVTAVLGYGIGGSHLPWKSGFVQCSGVIESVTPVYNLSNNDVFVPALNNLNTTQFVLFGTRSTEVLCEVLYR